MKPARARSYGAGTLAPESHASVALAVVTRDRPELFRRCILPGLRTAVADGFEVVVVDQSETMQTAELVSEAGGIRHVRSGPGVARGRNVALAETEAPLVAFTDDDVTIPDGWLDSVASAFEEVPDAGAVCGRGRTSSGELVSGRPAGVYRWPSHPFRLGHGFNFALRRAALDVVGPFDEELGAGARYRSAEDTDMLYRMLRAGWCVVCRDDITVVHHDWRSPSQERQVHFGYGFGAGAQTAKHLARGDRAAAVAALREAGHHLVQLVRAVVTLQPRIALLQLPFLAGLVRGIAARPRS